MESDCDFPKNAGYWLEAMQMRVEGEGWRGVSRYEISAAVCGADCVQCSTQMWWCELKI